MHYIVEQNYTKSFANHDLQSFYYGSELEFSLRNIIILIIVTLRDSITKTTAIQAHTLTTSENIV